MIDIIHPSEFKIIPWKNGKGTTTELAISKGGTLADFDWRLSIASVVEDGDFSDFSGYFRNLILIEGKGIRLEHDQEGIDELRELLSFASFDGGCKTRGSLLNGEITDFNLMTKTGKYQVDVETYLEAQQVKLLAAEFCFIYALTGDVLLSSVDNSIRQQVPSKHLIQISADAADQFIVKGQQLIVINLNLSKK